LIDPDNPKESILDDLLWTEKELKEVVRREINKITNKATFDDTVNASDLRTIRLVAVLHCPGANQPEVFQAIQAGLKGVGITMLFINSSMSMILKIAFEAPRWRPLESNP
jgi:predicted component of type VI protein secretion system